MPTNNPELTLPSSEQIAPGSTIDLAGVSYNDSYAAGNPGQLFLGVSDSSGTLSATDSAGVVPGSGTNSIGLSVSYSDLEATLSSLSYTAAVAPGSDTISFDIWDQAGVQTTGTIPITVASGVDATETWTGAVSSDWNTPGNWSGGAVPVSGDNVIIPAGTPNNATLSDATLTGETITVNGSASVNFTNVTLNSILQTANTGNLAIGGTLIVSAQGTLGPEQGGTLLVNSGGEVVPIVNDGTIQAPADSLLTINNGGTVTSNAMTVTNNGIISADGGNVSFDFAPPPFGNAPPETLTNSGSIVISNSGDLTLNGTFVGNDVAFAGTGALSLQQPNSFAGGSTVTGFGLGDQIDLYGAAQGGPLGYSNGILTAGAAAAIPLAGTFGLGNFESEFTGGAGNAEMIADAPGGGPSGVVQPDISAPASATVAQESTLSLGDVSISSSGTTQDTLLISAGSGTLFMNGATGSGTSHLSLGPTPESQIDADLASLSYVPAAGATADTVEVQVSPPAPVTTSREIPITVTSGGGSGGPTLNEPSSETVAAGAAVAVGGSYSDSFAQNSPGELWVGISDGSGTLGTTNASGATVAGSGTNSIGLSADYVDVNAILAGLHYTAGGAAGSDTIQFQVWNQAGAETTWSTAVTIDPPATGAAISRVDFAVTGGAAAGAAVAIHTSAGAASLAMLSDPFGHMIGIPAAFGR